MKGVRVCVCLGVCLDLFFKLQREEEEALSSQSRWDKQMAKLLPSFPGKERAEGMSRPLEPWGQGGKRKRVASGFGQFSVLGLEE